MSGEEKGFAQTAKEAEEKIEKGVMRVSELLQKGEQAVGTIEDKIRAQIDNNKELYATLSRSILEVHNDLRQFRNKLEGLDRIIFTLQQGINKITADFNTRIKDLEDRLGKLTDLWNEAVRAAEEKQNAINEQGEEDTGSNEEAVRREEG